jgi:hypothetical protein
MATPMCLSTKDAAYLSAVESALGVAKGGIYRFNVDWVWFWDQRDADVPAGTVAAHIAKTAEPVAPLTPKPKRARKPKAVEPKVYVSDLITPRLPQMAVLGRMFDGREAHTA